MAVISACGRAVRAFTLIEMLVVIAVLMILAALLLPSMQKAILMGQTTSCMNNLRGLGVAMQGYADDNRGWAVDTLYNSLFMFGPVKNGWVYQQTLCPYLNAPLYDAAQDLTMITPSPSSLCPSGRIDGTNPQTPNGKPNYSYGFNCYLTALQTGISQGKGTGTSVLRYGKLTAVRSPAKRAFCSDIITSATSLWINTEFPERHQDLSDNLLYVDLHSRTVSAIEKLQMGSGSTSGGMGGLWHDASW